MIVLVAVAAVACGMTGNVLAILVLAKLLTPGKAQPADKTEDMPEDEHKRSKEIAEGIENLLSYKPDI